MYRISSYSHRNHLIQTDCWDVPPWWACTCPEARPGTCWRWWRCSPRWWGPPPPPRSPRNTRSAAACCRARWWRSPPRGAAATAEEDECHSQAKARRLKCNLFDLLQENRLTEFISLKTHRTPSSAVPQQLTRRMNISQAKARRLIAPETRVVQRRVAVLVDGVHLRAVPQQLPRRMNVTTCFTSGKQVDVIYLTKAQTRKG